MEIILNYNFKIEDLDNNDFKNLYENKRRDSTFAFVYKDKKSNNIFAMRDHLGIVPLFYYKEGQNYKFQTNLENLNHENIDTLGLKNYISFQTTKIKPLMTNVKIVPPGSVLKINENGQEEIIYQYCIEPKKIK